MSALQPNSFLINFSLKPCTKVTTSSLQSVLIFALYPIVAGFTSLLFFIPLASVYLCCCFKDAGKICLCIVFHFLLSSSHSSVDVSKDVHRSLTDVPVIHLHYFRRYCSAISEHLTAFRSKFAIILMRSGKRKLLEILA